MKLTCINIKYAHWGEILRPGKEYEGIVEYKSTEIIIDYDNYWKYTEMIANSREWIKRGYDKSNMHEVMSGYKSYGEVHRLYTKRINMPYFTVKGEDGSRYSFCLLNDSELYNLGAAEGKDGKSKGKPCFSYTVHMVDDYFDYTSTRRDLKLNKIFK